MSGAKQWRVIDAYGQTHWPPKPTQKGLWFSCGSEAQYATARRAVTGWAAASIDVTEVVAPGDLSAEERETAMHERCAKACDDLFGVLEAGAEGDDDIEVTFVIDDAHGTDTQRWTPGECEGALEGVRLAKSAVDLVTAATEYP